MLCSTGIPTLQSILSFTAGEEVSLALLSSATEEKERDAGVGHRIVTVVREQLAMESLKKAGALKTNRDTMAH